MKTLKVKTSDVDVSELTDTQATFYRNAIRLYRKGIDWFAFWEFAFGFQSPLYDGTRLHTDVLGTPLETALRSMWLDLGVRQGMVKPEEPKRAPRRK